MTFPFPMLNAFLAAAASFYQLAVANGANTDISDPGGLQTSGTFTVPAAWNGRKVRAGCGARSSANSTGATLSMAKGGSQFDGAGAGVYPGITSNPGGGTIHSAPVVVSTGDQFTFSGPVNNTNGSWSYFEVLPNGVKSALVNRTSTFNVGTAFTTAQWNNEVYDTDGFFNSGSSTTNFVMPSGISGLVRVSANIELTSPDTEMGLRLNGGVSGTMEVDTANASQLNIVSPPLSRTVGQTVNLDIRCQSATTMAVDANTWIAIEELDASLKYAIARWSSNQSIASGSTFQTASPGSEDADVGGWYTAGNSFFTVPSGIASGFVRVGFFIKSTNTLGSAWGFGILKNASEFEGMPYNAQTNASVECLHGFSAPIPVTAGDTLDFRARTAAGSMAIAAGSFVWIEEVTVVSS